MDSTPARAPEPAPRAPEVAARVAEVGTRLGSELGAPLGKELRESALLLGLTLLVLGIVAGLASTTLLLG